MGLDADTGFVQLLHLAARYRINERWSLGLDHRGLEGGEDNADIYNFAWFNSATDSARLTFQV